MKPTIGVIGVWHLGCVICASWSKLGFTVTGFDYDAERIKKLSAGKPPIFEKGLEETINESMKKGVLSFTTNIASIQQCDYVFLSYDTPVREDDSSDTAILERAVRDAAGVMKDNAVLIISSQSPVGYCSTLRELLQSKNSTLELAYSPENLRLGEAIECYTNPGRIVLGTTSHSAEKKCLDLFSAITGSVLTMSLESAEMVKHGINAFLAMSILFANNLADMCEETHAHIDDVVKGMKSDVRIGAKAYLSPGIGFSGGTLGRDLVVLSEVNAASVGYAKLFEFIHAENNARKNAIVSKLSNVMNGLENKTIGVLGLTYKPGTSTLRRSLPLEVVDLLLKHRAKVQVYDPKADYGELEGTPPFAITQSVGDVSRNADLLVVLTEWPEFKAYDWTTVVGCMKTPIVFDTKNCLDRTTMIAAGFHYHSIGMK